MTSCTKESCFRDVFIRNSIILHNTHISCANEPCFSLTVSHRISSHCFGFCICRYSRNDTTATDGNLDDNFKLTFVVKVVREPAVDPNLGIIRRRSGDKHLTYFLTIYESAVNNVTESYVGNTLRKYYKLYNILNIVSIMLRSDGTHAMLTYLPFVDEVICLPPDTYLHSQLYFDKAKDFMGQPLKVSLFAEEVRAIFDADGNYGTDALIASLLAEKCNASLEIVQPTDDEEYGNPTAKDNATGTLGHVVREEVDIALNSRFLRLDLFYNNNIVEPTVAIGRDDMCILVPKATYIPMIFKLYQSLELSVWMLMLFIIVPFAGFFHFMAATDRTMGFPLYRRPILLDMLRSVFNQSLPHLPQNNSLRFLIIFWIIYCFLVTNILQSCLISSLTVRKRASDINYIADLIESPYRIVAATDYDRLIKRYFNQSGSNQNRLMGKLWPMPWTEYNVLIDESNTQYAYANKYHMNSYYASVKLSGGLPLYNAMRECLVPFLACYIVPFGSPFLNRFNDLISWTEQAGIFLYWERSMNENPKRMSQQVSTDNETHKPLQLQNMSLFFYLLLVGLVVSFLIFILELLYARRLHRKSRL